MLSCTQPIKIVANEVRVPHLGAGVRRACPKTGEGPLTFYIIYTKQQDKTTLARVGKYTCERPITASEDSLGPNVLHAFMSEARTN